MLGSAMYGGSKLSIKTVAAVEIELDPADTYKQAYPSVNVMQMGISRFLATGRRLVRLKEGHRHATGGSRERSLRAGSLVSRSTSMLPRRRNNARRG